MNNKVCTGVMTSTTASATSIEPIQSRWPVSSKQHHHQQLPSIQSLLSPTYNSPISYSPTQQLHPLQTLADASVQHEQGSRRMSVPLITPVRTGSDPVRGRPTIHKGGFKVPPKAPRRNFTQRRNTCIGGVVSEIIPPQAESLNYEMAPGYYGMSHPPLMSRRISIPGPGPMTRTSHSFQSQQYSAPLQSGLYTHMEAAPLSAPLQSLSSVKNEIEEEASSSSSSSTRRGSLATAGPLSGEDSKEAHRLKEQRRRDDMKRAVRELNARLDRFGDEGRNSKRSKIETLTLATKKIDELTAIIESYTGGDVKNHKSDH